MHLGKKRFILCTALWACCLMVSAQRFFNLTAQEVRIDSLLPVFTYAYPIGPRYADSIYTVSIEYPEFIPMSDADVKRYHEISGETLKAMPDVQQHIAVSRKQGALYVSFVPLVCRNGQYLKLVSFMLDIKGRERCVSAVLLRQQSVMRIIPC